MCGRRERERRFRWRERGGGERWLDRVQKTD
jgi:hypothetical protein